MESPATTQLNRCMNKLVQRIEMVGQQLKPDNKVRCMYIFLKKRLDDAMPAEKRQPTGTISRSYS
jgi:hypothetical protein